MPSKATRVPSLRGRENPWNHAEYADAAAPPTGSAATVCQCASGVWLRAREWLSQSPSRPMHPAWLRCSSVTYRQYAPSSRLASRAPRPRSSTDLAIRGPLVAVAGSAGVARAVAGDARFAGDAPNTLSLNAIGAVRTIRVAVAGGARTARVAEQQIRISQTAQRDQRPRDLERTDAR